MEVKEIEIDKITYKLKESNFIDEISVKNSIVIADTYNFDMNHYKEWNIFNNGSYNKTAHYTIDSFGNIFEHFSPDYASNFINEISNSIIILIENIGWLEKKGNIFLTWNNTIYNGEVLEKKWRNKVYWSKYNDKQLESTIFLINNLIENFEIPRNIKNNSFLDKKIENFKGIYYKSNISKNYKDINPSWDFKKMKKMLS